MSDLERVRTILRRAYADGAVVTVAGGQVTCVGPEDTCHRFSAETEPVAETLRAYLCRPTEDETWLAMRSLFPGPSEQEQRA